jgi:predicted CXXCH cytochrome family protein
MDFGPPDEERRAIAKWGAQAVILATVTLTTFSAGAVVGTPHDLSKAPWNTTGDICGPCHNTHNPSGPPLVPLWDHQTTTAEFVLYSSSTLKATPGQPAGISRACLSCHDGTVSIDAYGSSTGTGVYMTGSALLGTDLSTSHPISFTYDDALASADRGLFPPTTTPIPLLGTIAQAMLYGTSQDQMECGSCHSVHDNTNGNFLRITQAGSRLCLTCHNK